MVFPHRVTIYDKFEFTQGKFSYFRYVLYGVLYSSKLDSNVGSNGTVSSDLSVLQVPAIVRSDAPLGYSAPDKWVKGDDDFKENHFTFRKNQLIIKGDVELDISDNKPIDIAKVKDTYVDAFVVDKVITADYGAKNLQHWKLTGR